MSSYFTSYVSPQCAYTPWTPCAVSKSLCKLYVKYPYIWQCSRVLLCCRDYVWCNVVPVILCNRSFILTTMVLCYQYNWSTVVLNSWCLSNRVRSPIFYWCCGRDSTSISVALVRRALTFLHNCTHIYLASVHRGNVPTYFTTPARGQSQCTYIHWCHPCEDLLYLQGKPEKSATRAPRAVHWYLHSQRRRLHAH